MNGCVLYYNLLVSHLEDCIQLLSALGEHIWLWK